MTIKSILLQALCQDRINRRESRLISEALEL
jgi:hypothetical protein